MTTTLLILISLALLALFLYPILGPREVWDFDQVEGALGAAQRRRDRTLRALKDIELERETGALAEEEFHHLRNELKREAIAAMKDLDRVRELRLRHLKKPRASVPPSIRRRIDHLVAERAGSRES